MLQKLTEDLHREMLGQIDESPEGSSPIEKFKSSLVIVQKALAQIKIALNTNGFQDTNEEIWFFKYGKPKVYSFLIFLTERFAIENSMPIVGEKLRRLHLESQLLFINRFFRQNEFMYQYYRLNASDLDSQHFIRKQNSSVIGFAEVPEIDPSFSTVGDYLFSKFMGYERLQEWLKAEIQMYTGSACDAAKINVKAFRWTGEAVNMVELVYGIYETGQVNEGKISLSELMDFFGQAFQVNISGYFKRFADIKRRKSMSKTRYLDQMQQLVAKRIEDSDAWNPEEHHRRYGY